MDAELKAAIERLKRNHRKEPMRYLEADVCVTCRNAWPCDVITLVRTAERLATR